MRNKLAVGIKQGILILVVSGVVALVVNQIRDDGVPLVAEADAFRVQTDAEFLRIEDAQRSFEEGTAIFVDARDPEVFGAGHIEGAFNISPSMVGEQDLTWLAGSGTSVICYAEQANQRQAGVVADHLIQMGVENVFVLHGGLEAWNELGLPVEQGG